MGWLRRLFGKPTSAAPIRRTSSDTYTRLAPQPAGNPVLVPTIESREQNVVGVTYYPDVFKRVRPGRTTVELRCEPHNPYDKNAVAVVLNGKKAGHLSAHMAEGYQPILSALEREGPIIVEADVRSDVNGYYITLHLPDEDRLRVWASAEPSQRPTVGMEAVRVTLKRLGNYQEQLKALLGGQRRTKVYAEVTAYETSSGKYKGQPALQATVNGAEIGLIPTQYRDQAEELFAHLSDGGTETVEVWITHYQDTGAIRAVLNYYPPPRPPPPPTAPPPPSGAA